MEISISDAEKQELFFLRKTVKILEQENLVLRERMAKYENDQQNQVKIMIKSEILEQPILIVNEITKICSEINNHRIEKKGKCWFFGINGLKFDYGESWSNPTYWQALIKSNPITKTFCLFNFSFQKEQTVCQECLQKVDSLNVLYSSFLINLKKEYNI